MAYAGSGANGIPKGHVEGFDVSQPLWGTGVFSGHNWRTSRVQKWFVADEERGHAY